MTERCRCGAVEVGGACICQSGKPRRNEATVTISEAHYMEMLRIITRQRKTIHILTTQAGAHVDITEGHE